jgi:hypothetical protein
MCLAARFQDYYKVVMLSDQLTGGLVFPGGSGFLKSELAAWLLQKQEKNIASFKRYIHRAF